MITVAEYIAKRLVEVYNVKNMFLISGGGAMHLNDAFGKQPGLNYYCNHHEQASAISAEGYARLNQELAVVNVTTGPGGINTLNGVLGQWTDSVPVLYISGQVKFETTMNAVPEINLRQFGDQEANIIEIVKPITKYARVVANPNDIEYYLDKAIYLATSGRMGPVWLDIPLNVQGTPIDESKFRKFTPQNVMIVNEATTKKYIYKTLDLIEQAQRPLIVAGHGIRLSKGQNDFFELLNKLNIPVVTTFNGFDVIPDNHPNFIGRIGTIGQRAGNFALQNADLVIFLGTRNNIRQTSYNSREFAKNAKKIIIDIDYAELHKPTVVADLAIHLDLKVYLQNLNSVIKLSENKYFKWLNWCIERRVKYSPKNTYQRFKVLDPYSFALTLSEHLVDGDVLVFGNGSASVCYFQAATIKFGQRILGNSGNASMGYDLPAAIGTCIASGKKSTVCLTGDGSIMMNLQELATIKHYNLPIKIFVINNGGYSSIRQTQNNFFNKRLVGTDPGSGISIPNFAELAKAFGIKSYKLEDYDKIDTIIPEILTCEEPVLCEIITISDYVFYPKVSSQKLADGTMVSKPLEDMYPFLSAEEMANNFYHENE